LVAVLADSISLTVTPSCLGRAGYPHFVELPASNIDDLPDMREKTLVIVPVWNEGGVIEEVLANLVSTFPQVVVVDDGSTDDSREKALRAGVAVLSHPINLGQGAAIMTGIEWGLRESHFCCFATFDSDGQHRVADLTAAVRKFSGGGVDVVLGSRFLSHETQVPSAKRILLKLGLVQTRLATGLRLTDTHNGLRVFSIRIAELLRLSNGMSHASDFLHDLGRSGLPYTEIPTVVNYTEYSQRKGQPMINAVNILFDSIVRSK